jgi:drug/metabolite transporter (DMT)-like permease
MFCLFYFSTSFSNAVESTHHSFILYASIFSSILLSYLWIEGVRHLGPNKNSIFMNLLPIFTALIAVVLLGEHLQVFHLVGGGLTLCGILLAQMMQKPIQWGKRNKQS